MVSVIAYRHNAFSGMITARTVHRVVHTHDSDTRVGRKANKYIRIELITHFYVHCAVRRWGARSSAVRQDEPKIVSTHPGRVFKVIYLHFHVERPSTINLPPSRRRAMLTNHRLRIYVYVHVRGGFGEPFDHG